MFNFWRNLDSKLIYQIKMMSNSRISKFWFKWWGKKTICSVLKENTFWRS